MGLGILIFTMLQASILANSWASTAWKFDRWLCSGLHGTSKASKRFPKRESVRCRRRRFHSGLGRRWPKEILQSKVRRTASCRGLYAAANLDFALAVGLGFCSKTSWNVFAALPRWWSSAAAGRTSADGNRTTNWVCLERARPSRKSPKRNSNRWCHRELRETTTGRWACKAARIKSQSRFDRCWPWRGIFD